jgi:hypothetical protein
MKIPSMQFKNPVETLRLRVLGVSGLKIKVQ